jgi:hypothetical protein
VCFLLFYIASCNFPHAFAASNPLLQTDVVQCVNATCPPTHVQTKVQTTCRCAKRAIVLSRKRLHCLYYYLTFCCKDVCSSVAFGRCMFSILPCCQQHIVAMHLDFLVVTNAQQRKRRHQACMASLGNSYKSVHGKI